MRIGIDLLAAQSPHHGQRGIGRYARELASALVARAEDDGDDYVLYRRPTLDDPAILGASGARIAWRDLGDSGLNDGAAIGDRLARENPDRLDALLVLSPFESWGGYLPPSPPIGADRPALAAVLYDLIPFLAPPPRAPLHPDLRRIPHAARSLARYDALLAISESTRRDAIALMGAEPDRVANVGAASDPSRFAPPPAEIAPDERSRLARLGIAGPFVFCVGGMDDRKNFRGLVDAFALLPEPLRRGHQLVVTCSLSDDARRAAMAYAGSRGVGRSLVLTGQVDDATLALLYGRCAAFAFPSTYEGFGLPILEAMHCGAPVVAAENSSQPEVVGDAGLLADASDPAAFARALGRILSDPPFAASLKAKALDQAARFSWAGVAEKAREAIAGAVAVRASDHSVAPPAWKARPDARSLGVPPKAKSAIARVRPRLAIVSPLPPRGSGIADYTAKLVEELRRDYRIDLFHDGAYTPLPCLADRDLVAADARLLSRIAAGRDYRAIVYQMGNSRFHQFSYPLMFTHPGVVTLHDFALAGFHQHYQMLFGVRGDHFLAELEHGHSGRYQDVIPLLGQGPERAETVTRICSERGLWANRRVLEAAESVIVHSPWCVARAREQSGGLAGKCVVVPMGTTLGEIAPGRRGVVRERFGLPVGATIVASFGYIHPDKMNAEAIEAFSLAVREVPDAIFAFVGGEADGGIARDAAARCGIADRVRFLGRRSLDEFQDLASVADIGVNLRRPPTNGETSAALLDLIRWGVPTIVTDVATFADYPDAIVAKVRWPDDGVAGLASAMRTLLVDPARRRRLGAAAHEHVRRFHQWRDVAARYGEVIERAAEARGRSRLRGAS